LTNNETVSQSKPFADNQKPSPQASRLFYLTSSIYWDPLHGDVNLFPPGTFAVTVHDPILSEVTFGARRFKTASKDGLGFKGQRRGHWA
jgi:hypothetical protein